MALTLTDLQKMIEQQDGLYPLDMYRANTPRQGIGSVNIPNVNLQGAPNVSPGTVLDTSQMSGAANLPTATLSTGTMSTTGSDRLDDLITGVNRGDLRSSLLSNLNKEDINLGNIDDISRTLTDELLPTQTKGEKSNVLRIIKGIIGAGQSPEFRRGMELAEAEKVAGAKATKEARADIQKTIYGKLLDDYLEDDSFTPKLQPIFTINRTTGKETGGILRKIRDGNGFERDEVFALALDERGNKIKQDEMTTNQIFYQGNVYRPLEPQAESWDKDRLNLREAFNLDRDSGSQTGFDKQVDKYSERLLALDAMYGLANTGLNILREIIPAGTDQFGLSQAIKGIIVSFDQQFDQMGELLLGDDSVKELANARGISVNELKDQNTAATERMREVFRDPNKLNGVVGENGQEFNWDRFGRLSDDKAKDSQYKSILLQMAYQAAMINGQEGRSLSDKDIVNMLNIVGGEVSDVNGAMRLMASFVLQTADNLERRGKRYRDMYSIDIDNKPYSKEAVELGFIDPFDSLVKNSPNKTKAVLNIINRSHPDLLENILIDSNFDYKSYLDPNTPDDTATPSANVTQDDINNMFTNRVLNFNLNTDD